MSKILLPSWLSSNTEGISYAIDNKCLVQESTGLNPNYFDDISSFSQKNESILSDKLQKEKLDNYFLSSVCHLFLNIVRTFSFFHFQGHLH